VKATLGATLASMGFSGLAGLVVAALVAYLAHLAHHRRQVAKLKVDHKHAEEIAALHLRTIEALAVAIDAKDNTTHQHLERVLLYADAIGRSLHLSEDEMKALRAAALLHDIGKLAVPEYIISKPGRLTEEEFEKMKIHTIVGAEILERVRFPYPVVPMVRSHHERWNGAGYPDGLKGIEIPVGARILAVVDAFDALASDRQYRRALSPQQALAAIRQEAGEAYDPFIVEILEKTYPEVERLIAAAPPQPGAKLSTHLKIEKGGRSPKAGLSVEVASDTNSALYSIAQAKQELQILYELTQALGNSLSVEDTMRLLTNQLQKLIQFDTIAVYLTQDGVLRPRFVEGVNARLLAPLQIPLGTGLSGWVAGNGKFSLNGNPAVEPGYVEHPGEFSKLRSALSVPLDSTKGIIGALTLYSVRPNAFKVDHLRVLKAIGMKAGATINNSLIHEEIGRSADTDGLTGLPNSRALMARLEQETARSDRQRLPYAVFVLDLNGLKTINDRHGHLEGNRALRAVAQTLERCLREYDMLARIGGDEFVILLPGMSGDEAAEKRIELAMAVDRMAEEFAEFEVSVSMGSATYPADGRNPEQLLGLADRRMYWHKRQYYQARSGNAVAVLA
jgi:diguanylate cyclase (GGDEF)-like protein/putative nucleotidyltransferase with HDIG domain